MSQSVYRYTIPDASPLEDIQATFDLALLGVQSLHGESRVRLDVRFVLDTERRAFIIDASTEAGESLNQLFVGYLRQELGEQAFRVERLDRLPAAVPAGAAT